MSHASSTKTPPRYRWLVRLTLVGIAGLLGLVAVRWAWERHAKAALAEQLKQLQETGTVFGPAFFTDTQLRDADNAALVILEAESQMTASSDLPFGLEDAFSYPALRTAAPEVVARILADHAAALATFERVRNMPEAHWPTTVGTPLLATNFGTFAAHSALAKLLKLDAHAALEEGDVARAAQRMQDCLTLGDRVRRPPAVLISALVATAVEALGTHMAIDLITASPQQLDQEARTAIQATIDQLLDIEPVRTSTARALRGEAVMMVDVAEFAGFNPIKLTNFAVGPGAAPPGGGLLGWVFTPLMRGDIAVGLQRLDAYVEAVQQPTSVGVAALTDPAPDYILYQLPHTFRQLIMPNPRTLDLTFQAIAHRRAAAAALAAHLYRDEQGSWPPNLEALVPTYLPSVPEDPYAPEGTPLRYEVDGDRLRIYAPETRETIWIKIPPDPEDNTTPANLIQATKTWQAQQALQP